MNSTESTLQAVRLKGRIGPDRKLEITENTAELPEGEVEIILLYPKGGKTPELLPPLEWPALNGGKYLGGSLRREEIYDDDGR